MSAHSHPGERLQAIIDAAVGVAAPAVQVVIRHAGDEPLTLLGGYVDAETRQQAVNAETLFDLASVTKLFTVSAFMRLVEEGLVSLDDLVSSVLPEFCGLRPIEAYEDPLYPGAWVQPAPGARELVDAGQVAFRHLLTHTSGLPAWKPLFRQPDADSARRMALETAFFYSTGTRVVYSDLGLILTGMALERLSGLTLDACIAKYVTQPLGLRQTRFLPVQTPPQIVENAAPTEWCAWRGRRICGEVHDENAWQMGGVSGHAGLFSTAADLAVFGQSFLSGGLLKPETVEEMTRLQASDRLLRRGLGFTLWSPDNDSIGNPFHPSSFGHTGFTGTSLWIDPARQLVAAVLTNRVYYGRSAEQITAMRLRLHRALAEIYAVS